MPGEIAESQCDVLIIGAGVGRNVALDFDIELDDVMR